ncbi:MAG: Ubiquinone biosynthesis O-methyltransferase, mitochondrial [Sodalis sp.]|nr:MAG: Ubiquinone biosynthesis O-methyltransferase, mitochondrial [Sodalis sp.]
MDLGCAQGFFCLSLAERGDTVKGIDLQDENISVCCALADENPQVDASFDAPESDQYDMAIGLSVFHHIVHRHGVARTQRLRGETLYGDLLSRADARELLRDCAFLGAPLSGFVAPALLGHDISGSEGWLITERLECEYCGTGYCAKTSWIGRVSSVSCLSS